MIRTEQTCSYIFPNPSVDVPKYISAYKKQYAAANKLQESQVEVKSLG